MLTLCWHTISIHDHTVKKVHLLKCKDLTSSLLPSFSSTVTSSGTGVVIIWIRVVNITPRHTVRNIPMCSGVIASYRDDAQWDKFTWLHCRSCVYNTTDISTSTRLRRMNTWEKLIYRFKMVRAITQVNLRFYSKMYVTVNGHLASYQVASIA